MPEGIISEPAAPTESGSVVQEPVGQAVTQAIADQKTGEASKVFLDSLPESLRGHESLKTVKGTADLATQFINQQSLIGNSLRIPTEDTAEEQRNAFYSKLSEVPGVVRLPGEDADDAQQREFLSKIGVPATPNEYKLEAPEGYTPDQEYIQNATQKAHELNLSNKQFNEFIKMEAEAEKAAQIAQQEYIESAKNTLKSIWSNDYDNRVAGATNAMRVYREEMPEFAAELDAISSNPLFVKILSDLGQQLQERGHAGMQSAGNYGLTVEDAKLKISEIMSNPDHPYFKGDQEQISYMLKLNEIVAGSGE